METTRRQWIQINLKLRGEVWARDRESPMVAEDMEAEKRVWDRGLKNTRAEKEVPERRLRRCGQRRDRKTHREAK